MALLMVITAMPPKSSRRGQVAGVCPGGGPAVQKLQREAFTRALRRCSLATACVRHGPLRRLLYSTTTSTGAEGR